MSWHVPGTASGSGGSPGRGCAGWTTVNSGKLETTAPVGSQARAGPEEALGQVWEAEVSQPPLRAGL